MQSLRLGYSNYYLIYFIISLLLIIYSIITFFVNQQIYLYLNIISVSIVFTLYFLQLSFVYFDIKYLSDLNKARKIIEYKMKTKRNYDTRSEFNVYQTLKLQNPNVVRPIYPAYVYLNKNILDETVGGGGGSRIFPLAGIADSETLMCNENGYYSKYKSDRYGFNNPDSEWNNKIEYVLLGDSFIHGECVNPPDDIASILRILSNKSVLALGYGGYGPISNYAALREYFKEHTKKILFFYYERNDLAELNEELQDNILIRYINEVDFSQNLKNRQRVINYLGQRKLNEIEQLKKLELEKNIVKKNVCDLKCFLTMSQLRELIKEIILKRQYNKSYKHYTEYNPKIIEVIKLAHNFAKENNSEFYVVYLPEYYRYVFKNYDNANYLKIKDELKKNNISFIDIVEVFNKNSSPINFYPFALFGHYNEKGFKVIAETIYKSTIDSISFLRY